MVEKWLKYWQWPTKLAIEAPTWSLNFFVVLTLLLPTGGLPKKISAQLVEKWLRYWQWPTKLAIEAPSWSLKFFVVLTLLLPIGGLPKNISAQLVEKWLRYWEWPTKLAVKPFLILAYRPSRRGRLGATQFLFGNNAKNYILNCINLKCTWLWLHSKIIITCIQISDCGQ